jgi:hypothetical protein
MTYHLSSGARRAVIIAVAAVLPAAQTTVTPALDNGVAGQL